MFYILRQRTKVFLLTSLVIVISIVLMEIERSFELNRTLCPRDSMRPPSQIIIPPFYHPKVAGIPAFDYEEFEILNLPDTPEELEDAKPRVEQRVANMSDKSKLSSESLNKRIPATMQNQTYNRGVKVSDDEILRVKSMDTKKMFYGNKTDGHNNKTSEENIARKNNFSKRVENGGKFANTTNGIESKTNDEPIDEMLCPLLDLKSRGPIKVEIDNVPSLKDQEKLHPELSPGGRYQPPKCKARQTTAIIVPFRNREKHLAVLLHNLHPFLQRQNLCYGIYIIKQEDNYPYNRGMLMDVGYRESLNQFHYNCFVFHEVDILPEDDRILYKCSDKNLIHLSHAISAFNYTLPYHKMLEGAIAITRRQFRRINGFSTLYWGSGFAENGDLLHRLNYRGVTVKRFPIEIARYKALQYEKEPQDILSARLYEVHRKRILSNGLNSIQYFLPEIEATPLFTWINVTLIDVH